MPKGWIDPIDALRINPDFFKERGDTAWVMEKDGFGLQSRFGAARIRVQTNPDGTPQFDRVAYTEAPAINAVAWGETEDGIVKVAVVNQVRPFADNPDRTPADPPIIFGQPCIMGFRDTVLGKELGQQFEAPTQAAVREAGEEAGARGILWARSMGEHISQPSFATSWCDLVEIKVDLDTVTSMVDSKELIHSAEYLALSEIRERISAGWVNGVCYRSAVANATFFTWLTQNTWALVQMLQEFSGPVARPYAL